MALVDIGGGGGRAGGDTSDVYGLDKPYDINGIPTADKMALIDEMFGILFKSMTRGKSAIDALNAALGATGTGDVVGPSSAVSGDVVLFDGTTGKLVKDGGSIQLAAAGSVDVSSGATTPTGAGIISVRRTISNAEILAGTALTIINGLAGYWITPLGFLLMASDASGGVYGSTRTLSARYTGAAYDLVSPTNFVQAAVAAKRYSGAAVSVNINLQTVTPDGVGIDLVFSGGNTGGNAANQGIIMCSFMVIQSTISGF